ncbi:protein translocase subunit SecF [Gracilinema caldarium]|uniref:Protein-export membrane protein SecF n=1 Tax=Gracilinema caldarium (strain ATCC 51460 / DSM 7334 / H1) TaxID=744872 RepID=F8F3M5_GRAC1|nr:protein translocase subunit SecF [Gracilinema caldarium]AEJ19969.1 protein-export membrane protein SecF [Gracilinema caldarium DSM 7334]
MKQILKFSRFFLPAVILSLVLIISGIVGYVVYGGFNLGVDFQAGLIQEIQFAPTAIKLTYTGKGVAGISMDKNKLEIIISGSDVEKRTYTYTYASYPTLGSMIDAMSGIEGLAVEVVASRDVATNTLVQSAQGNPRLGSVPYGIHYITSDVGLIHIAEVRKALASLGNVSVQNLGQPKERKFLIRVEDKGTEQEFAKHTAEQISSALTNAFGEGQVAISRTDYVGARFSKHLTEQAGLLLFLTMLLILVYVSFRFKFHYAAGAVLAILHDGLIMVAFIVWLRMEFNTTTIAAILTILGYSINDTIVIFDRIRETLKLNPDSSFEDNLNRAITETLSRTFITTITTMFAVLSLFLFTTGAMRDFALALLIGMTSGVYSTIFIASAFVLFWEKKVKKDTIKAAVTASAGLKKA